MQRFLNSKIECRMPFVNSVGIRAFIGLVVLLAGCNSQSNNSVLVGRWQVSELQEIAARVVDDAEELDDSKSKMSIEFQSSGSLKTETSIGSINSSKVGTWRLLSHDADRGVVKIECVLQAQRTQHEIEFESDDLIRWVPPNMAGTSSRMQFERLK